MEPRRKKILYLITKSNWGGAQRYVYDLATTLDKTKFEAVVALGGDGVLKEQLEHARIRTISIDSLQRDVSIKKEIAFAQELQKIIKSEEPDVLHVNSSKAGAVGTLIGRLTKVPLIIFTAHGWAFNEGRPALQKLVFKCIHWLTVKLSHKTIAVSQAIVSQLQWFGITQKFIVIHPGRTIGPMYGKIEAREKLANIHPILREHLQKPWCITIAELHPIKRIDIIIRAFHKLKNKKVISVIIGDGQLREELEKQIVIHSLENRVLLVGSVTEAARFLKAADLFVLTSDSESYGYVIHEAGLAKVPVIATRVGGIPEIVTSATEGTLIPPHDSDTLAEVIDSTLTDKTEAKEKAENLYESLLSRTKEKMTLATAAVYELAIK